MDTVRYSVPHAFVRCRLEVAVLEDCVRIYDGASLVAEHRRSNEPHSVVLDPAHHAGLWRPSASTVTTGKLEAMGRSLADYENALQLARPPEAGLLPRGLLRPEDRAKETCEAISELGGAP